MPAGRITALISRFRRDTSANIAVIFAIATIPILTAVGCATDYSMAARMKTKLQSAADTASLRSGAVDSRLLATLASLSAQFTLRVVSFSDSSPGAPLLFRAVTVASSGTGALAEVRALVNAQLSPYLPARSATVGIGPGQAGLLIQFAAPGPLGLLTPALTADTQSVKGN